MAPAFVAVHVGAGHHARSTEAAMKQLCADTCLAAMKRLRDGSLALDAAEAAVQRLEDHPATNAGTGSALNWDGKVECDAAIMDGNSNLFACIGAVPSNSCSSSKFRRCQEPCLAGSENFGGAATIRKTRQANVSAS